ncbi:hypothetical protein Tco_1299825 [Tanacetum coccineum]
MNSPPNHKWEQAHDIDDFDIRLTLVVRPSNNPHILSETTTTTQTMFSSQNHQVDNYVMKPIRIIPCPAGIIQTATLCKITNTQEGVEESIMSTQEYIRKVIEDVGEDDNFTRAPWLSVVEYVNVDGGIVTGCFGDVKKFLKNGKLEKVVAIIKSCFALGNLTVTLKDLSGIISGTIRYKVLTEERFEKAIIVGAVLILHNVYAFSPKQSTHHYLNITKKIIVKVFHKDGGHSQIALVEYLVKISKRHAFWSLNKDILKITILTTNTLYPSRKIRRICACTHQKPRRKYDQYAISREDQYAILKI